VTYNAEISEIRKKIDSLDREIFDKILVLLNSLECYKKRIPYDMNYSSLIIADAERRANQRDLDGAIVGKIFYEIIQLIDGKEVNS
jgi:hypothetical protein